jgi:hypothetical protein
VASGSSDTPVGSLTVSPPWTGQAGDVVVLAMWWASDADAAVTGTISDGGMGNPVSLLGQVWDCGALSVALAVAVLQDGGALSWTVSASSAARTGLVVAEYAVPPQAAGLYSLGVRAGHNQWTGPVSVSAGWLPTRGPDDLVFAVVNDGAGRSHGAGAGFTVRADVAGCGSAVPGAYADQTGLGLGSVWGAWSLGLGAGQGNWLAAVGGLSATSAQAVVDCSEAYPSGPFCMTEGGYSVLASPPGPVPAPAPPTPAAASRAGRP